MHQEIINRAGEKISPFEAARKSGDDRMMTRKGLWVVQALILFKYGIWAQKASKSTLLDG